MTLLDVATTYYTIPMARKLPKVGTVFTTTLESDGVFRAFFRAFLLGYCSVCVGILGAGFAALGTEACDFLLTTTSVGQRCIGIGLWLGW